MKKVGLSNEKNFTLVDDEFYHALITHKWHCHNVKRKTYYARRSVMKNGVIKTIYMHHIILPPKDGYEIDHKNGNGLDNRRKNLRFVTRSQNHANIGKTLGRSSKFKGVYKDKRINKWVSRIKVNQKNIYLGSFKNEKDAARVYNKYAVKFFGDFSKLNVI